MTDTSTADISHWLLSKYVAKTLFRRKYFTITSVEWEDDNTLLIHAVASRMVLKTFSEQCGCREVGLRLYSVLHVTTLQV